jgi:group I intron endonuclease
MVTCIVTGKRYVGITDIGVDLRWRLHVQHALGGASQLFARAIRKHSPRSFTVETLEECPDRETLLTRERRWIAELGTFRPNGYNSTLGDEGIAGHRHSDETRRRMSESRRRKKMPPRTAEHRRRLGESRKGKGIGPRGPSGYRHTEDARRRISEALRKRPRSVTPVDQLTVGGELVATYPSAQAAAESIRGADNKILLCCRGLRKTHCGFIWRYASGAEQA